MHTPETNVEKLPGMVVLCRARSRKSGGSEVRPVVVMKWDDRVIETCYCASYDGGPIPEGSVVIEGSGFTRKTLLDPRRKFSVRVEQVVSVIGIVPANIFKKLLKEWNDSPCKEPHNDRDNLHRNRPNSHASKNREFSYR